MSRSIPLAMTRAVTRNLLDAATIGVALLNDDDLVVWTNSRAKGLLSRGRPLSCREARLHARAGNEMRALQLAIVAAREPNSPGEFLVLQGADGAHALELLVCAVSRQALFNVGSASLVAVLIADPSQRPRLCTDSLQRMHSLTPTEARIARSLAAGISVREIAVDLGVQPNTVRVHLKSIYAKTRTGGQADLVRRLLCGLGVIGCFVDRQSPAREGE